MSVYIIMCYDRSTGPHVEHHGVRGVGGGTPCSTSTEARVLFAGDRCSLAIELPSPSLTSLVSGAHVL
jgi:hypothetical protein